MRLAIVVGGWHWPLQPFLQMSIQATGADLFAIGHRSPDLPIVREEKKEILAKARGPLAKLDRELYREYATVDHLRELGWKYEEAPNTVGDWGFFNQWLERYGYKHYDVILNCHDDTYIIQSGLFDQARTGNWLLLANGRYAQAPAAYVRGSFEFWKTELLGMLGGRVDLGPVRLTREGKTDTPSGLQALAEWNNTGVPLRDFMVKKGLANRVSYLSCFYRISKWVIEAERGFLHYKDGAPWSFEDGVEAILPTGAREHLQQVVAE